MPPHIQILNPDSLGKPLGQYSQITRVKASEFLFIAGQVGASKDGKTPADFDGQCSQVFANIGAALASQGAGFGNLVEFTTYMVHSQDIPKFMAWRTREFPKLFPNGAYPPNTLLMIDRVEGITKAAPTPMIARARMTAEEEPLAAAKIEPARKTSRPICRAPLRP